MQLRHKADLARLGAMLPGLLEELRATTHVQSGRQRERAFALLGEAYCAAWQIVHKLGYLDLASLTEDRYERAAARCGDELAILRGDYGRAGELITNGDFTAARVPGTLPRHDRRQTGPCRRSHPVDVGQPAPQICPWMCFGPTNVAIWSVGLAVEALDGTEAITRAEGFIPPPSAPRERVGHYWIDLARDGYCTVTGNGH